MASDQTKAAPAPAISKTETQKEDTESAPTKKPEKRSRRANRARRAQSTKAPATSISAETLPRRTLAQVVRAAEVLHNNYAGKATSWDDLATAAGLSPKGGEFKYLVWSASAYGILSKNENGYSVAEAGRKIVAPNYEGEDREGRLKAVMTPILLSKFFSDFNGYQLPGDQLFPNVLENKYQVPRERTVEAIKIIVENARYSGILVEVSGQPPKVAFRQDLGVTASVPPPPPAEGGRFAQEVTSLSATEANWKKSCFYTPLGADDSEDRKHADLFLKHLLEPVAQEFGLTLVRADKIERSGLITQQIFDHLAHSGLCVADLSFGNPNAFYELGVRHALKRPTIQIIRKGDKIPFDVAQGRTIIIDTSDRYTITDRLDSARRELAEHVRGIVEAAPQARDESNPIDIYLPGLEVRIPEPAGKAK